MDFLGGLWDFFVSVANDPVTYCIFFYIFSVLAAIVLPLPVELGLFLNPSVDIVIKALILGAGKATGSILVFYIGFSVEKPIRRWSTRWHWFKHLVDGMEWLVAKLKYVGLYVLLSIPLMTDTVPIYLWSIFNKEGKAMRVPYFALTNLLAGITRASIVYVLFIEFGIKIG